MFMNLIPIRVYVYKISVSEKVNILNEASFNIENGFMSKIMVFKILTSTYQIILPENVSFKILFYNIKAKDYICTM